MKEITTMPRKLSILCGVTLLAGWQIGACTPAVTIPVNVPLNDSGSFDVGAGTPAAKTATFTDFDTGGVSIGRGSLEIKPSAISVTPAGTSGNKISTTNEQVADCQGACASADLTAEDCDKICEDQTLRITVWFDAAANAATACASGTQFGPFDVALENGQPASVSPSSVDITSAVNLINSGNFSLCIEVVSPIAGTVTIDSLTLNLGL